MRRILPLVAGISSLGVFRAAALNLVTNLHETEIPPLKPPRAELPPTFMEQHGAAVWLGAVAALIFLCLAVFVIVKLATRERIEDPLATVKRGLAGLKNRPEDGALLTQVSQLLRNYVKAICGFPEVEVTTTELRQILAEDDHLNPELSAAVGNFLVRCDEYKFAPRPLPPKFGAVAQAEELVKKLATWHREEAGVKPVEETQA